MNPDIAFDTLTREAVLVCPKCGVRLARGIRADAYLSPELDCPRPARFVRRAGERAQ